MGVAWDGASGDYWHDILPAEAWQENRFDERAFELLYTGHGGSGLSLTLHEVGEMDVTRIAWWRERLSDQRKADAEAIKEAARGR
jgi:hypothetical protein